MTEGKIAYHNPSKRILSKTHVILMPSYFCPNRTKQILLEMKAFIPIILLFAFTRLSAQQIADTAYNPAIASPAYALGKGPILWIDEGHHNFHTKEGRYQAFARLTERDGYQVEAYKGKFDLKTLSQGKILVISNALHKKNVENWYVPIYSAFTQKEIKALKDWVESGGRLWLIADHMPLAGAAIELAAAFGFTFTDGFALDTLQRGPSVFSYENFGLVENVITQGRDNSESVNEVLTFTGQAFDLPEKAQALLILDEHHINLLPDTAWVFNQHTQRMPAKGKSQGAFMEYGKGRIVFFGEAAMFSAQLAGPQKQYMGMNHPSAAQNHQLLLNIVHWLDGIL